VLREVDDKATPEEALEQFARYQMQRAEKSLEALQGTGLFFDLYHPLAALRSFDLRVRMAQRNAEAFVQDVEQGRYDGLSFRMAAPCEADRKGATCPVGGHLEPPHFAFDPDINSLLFAPVPPAVRAWDIYDSLEHCPGFTSMCWSRPSDGELTREVRARFASEAQAQGALALLAGMEVGGRSTPQPRLVTAVPGLAALLAPPEMSHPDRVLKDAQLSEQVVRRLDALMGVGREVTEALLGRKGTPEQRLDLQVLYLRRAHHFCFYAARWCGDEWELRAHCGPALLRGGGVPGAVAPAEGEWAQAHGQRLEHFLKTTWFDRPSVPSCGGGDDELALAGAINSANTHRVSEGKYQCAQCKKCFRGPEYVHKHLRKFHADLLEVAARKPLEEAARAAYLRDPCRPLHRP